MALRQLYNLTSGSLNPTGLTGILPGGAGVQVAGVSTNPGISAPRLEEVAMEVLDTTAPTNIGTSGTVVGTPAAPGKLLVMDYANTTGGAKFVLNSAVKQPLARGQYGIVAGTVKATAVDTGFATSTVAGNRSPGQKSLVYIDGPVNAFVTTVVDTTAISAGMKLAADGAGNLTYAGASPAVGTVLATALGSVSGSVSTPTLIPVYVGGY